MTAYVLLEDGTRFDGEACAAPGPAVGEVVFTTGMSGYQECVTDPSFHAQLLTFTAPMGTIGLETAFAAVHTELVVPGILPLALVVDRMTSGAALLDLPVPGIAADVPANLTLVDLAAEWEVGEDGYESRSENCCFAGRRLRGRILLTVAGGSVAYRERALVAA